MPEDVATGLLEGGGNKRVSLENVLASDVRIRIDGVQVVRHRRSQGRPACPPPVVMFSRRHADAAGAPRPAPDLRVVRPVVAATSSSTSCASDAPAGAVHGGLEGVGHEVPPLERRHLQI